MFDDLIFPGVLLPHWQMMQWERIALTGLLSRLRPSGALEIGVYHGGSLSLTSQYTEHMVAIDIDPQVAGRFSCPSNVELKIGSSADLIPSTLDEFRQKGLDLNFVLIDADHSAEGVKKDIELVLAYRPASRLVLVIHDSGNPETRRGIKSADWSSNPHVKFVDLDFVPGQIIEHSVTSESAEVWGGLAVAYLDNDLRAGHLEIRESAKTSIRCIHFCSDRISLISE